MLLLRNNPCITRLLGANMSQQGRNKLGKFSAKSDTNRQVRSIRLTDATWNKLGDLADERSITRADLLEDWMDSEYFELQNSKQ